MAERTGIAQSTLMHHFETREALLVEAVEHVAVRLAERALTRVDLSALRSAEHRELALDEAWEEFSSPEALAAAQLWGAVWTEPELAPALRELELRIGRVLLSTSQAMMPELAEDRRLAALIDAAIALVRGLVIAIPVWGREAVDARWRAIKPLVVDAAAHMLDD